MYIRCNNCDWEQDDFWDKDYNPISTLSDYKEIFNECLVDKNLRNNIIGIFKNIANRVTGMKWWTYEEFKSDLNPTCPNCNSGDFNLD